MDRASAAGPQRDLKSSANLLNSPHADSPRGPAVLLIDDEVELAAAVASSLERHGFSTNSVGSLTEARGALGAADLILLDLGLPDGDGLTVCGEFAAHAPVIVVSARSDEIDRVVALELGADDYLSKPFSTRELVARCRAVLRRTQRESATTRILDLELDFAAFEVRRDREAIPLTTKELELLFALSRHAGDAIRRTQLALEVWGAELSLVSRTLEVHVSSLRTKLGPAPDGAEYVSTVHGIGYRLHP